MINEKQVEKFIRKRKRAIKNPVKYAGVFEDSKNDTRYYIEHGRNDRQQSYNERLPFLPWEFLKTEFVIPTDYYEMSAQSMLIQEGSLCSNTLSHSLCFAHINCIITYFTHKRYVIRFDRERKRGVSPDSVFYLVMAVILQQPERAEHIFKLLQVGYPKFWINRSKSHIGDFIILLFDAVKGGKQLQPIVDDFAYVDIVARWDTCDLQELTGYLTQLCDDQVAQVASPPSKMYFEFDNMNWQFTPYAALLLLALRAERGLPNPDFSHPGFGNITQLLPDEPVAPVEDELLSQLLACMRAQGFDEEALMNV
ncbi:hypothetical protein [Pseudoalteromonas obscura]|uniref:Uncharacterized protein n=1 Tax=Pseudoalteromonas obscura TaxID=3048491 RepID=A0ABT7EEV0_9GAMM|nr:hypothetical protein [Pseudoalteromonas sp. P94(2023)]MDK2593795.1 hypothetical protein [Pseudoalteromonas sp. P94(2023)]